MGWNEHGKYGITTGRTVRSSFAYCSKNTGRWNPRIDTETLFKFTRGTDKLTRHELDEFLSINDIDDDLGDFSESMFQLASERVHYCSVLYSLKKRKRWMLAESVSSAQLDDRRDRRNISGNVTFIHRRVERKLKADCIAVHKLDKDIIFRSKTRSYARATDLLTNSDGIKEGPELCYEISYRYPAGSYPVYAEVHKTWVRDQSSCQGPFSKPHKARSRDTGAKHKGARTNILTEAQIRDERMFLDEQVEMCSSETPRQFCQNKITVLNSKCFNLCKSANETLSNNTFEVGQFVNQSLATSATNVELKDFSVSDSKRLYSEVVSRSSTLKEPSLLQNKVSNFSTECGEISGCGAESDSTWMYNRQEARSRAHATSFNGVFNFLPETINKDQKHNYPAHSTDGSLSRNSLTEMVRLSL